MIESKTIDLLKTFSEEEFREFGLFVQSPYFNKENVQRKFYEAIKKYYPEFTNRNFTKEKIYKILYPARPYSDGVMRNILSRALYLIERFLICRKYEKSEVENRITLMREFSERRMDKLFENVKKEADVLMNKRETKNEKFYYDRYTYLNEIRMHSVRQKSSMYSTNIHLKEMLDVLSVSFTINILRGITYMVNSNISNYSFENVPFKELVNYVEKGAAQFREIPYIRLFYNAYMLAKTNKEVYFYELKKISENDMETLEISEQRDIYKILTNYCYAMINKGELRFRKEHFLINKESIESGNYKKGVKTFSHITFTNIAVTAIDAGETEWVSGFIENHKHELDDVNRDSTYNFCRALLNYSLKKYDEALKLASNVKVNDYSYKHQLKSLYLKIFFESNETEGFYTHIDSYRHFIANEKNIPTDAKTYWSNYIHYAKKLFDIKQKEEKSGFALSKLRSEIIGNRYLINRQWLLEMIDEIEVRENQPLR